MYIDFNNQLKVNISFISLKILNIWKNQFLFNLLFLQKKLQISQPEISTTTATTTVTETTQQSTVGDQEHNDRTYFLHKCHKQGGLMGHANLWYLVPFYFFTFASFKFDENGMVLALPNIQKDLNISESTAQWFTSMYFIACASLAIPLSRYAETVGYVNLQLSLFVILIIVRFAEFFISLYVKNITALLASLLVLRFIDGGVCGGLISSRNSMVAKWPSKKHRAQSFNLVMIVNNVAAIIIPSVAGIIIDDCGYQYKFLVEAILAVLSIISIIPLWEHKKVVVKKTKFDIFGSILLVLIVGMFCLALTIVTKQQYIGFAVCLVISIISLIGFVFVEKRHQDPILPLSVMKNPISDLFVQNLLIYYTYSSQTWIMPQITSSSEAGIINTIMAVFSIICSLVLPIIKKKLTYFKCYFVHYRFHSYKIYQYLFIFSTMISQVIYPMTNTSLPPSIVSIVSGLPTSSRTIGNSISTCVSAAVVNLLPKNYPLALQIDLYIMLACLFVGLVDSIFRIGVSKDEVGKLGFQIKNIRQIKLDKMYDQMIQQAEQTEKQEEEQIKQKEQLSIAQEHDEGSQDLK